MRCCECHVGCTANLLRAAGIPHAQQKGTLLILPHCHLLTRLQGETIKDPFRRGLGLAILWHDNLQQLIEKKLDAIIELSDQNVQAHLQSPENNQSSLPLDPPPTLTLNTCGHTHPHAPEHTLPSTLTPEQCARILRQRCLACFGGILFGRSFTQ